MPKPWYLTTGQQIKVYKREVRRIDEAVSRQDVRGIGSPLARMRMSAVGSVVLGVLILVAAFVVSMISPKPDGSLSEIVVTRGGGMFVQFNGRIHPVTNLASARLIVGKAAEAKVVTDSALAKMPTGPLMGIPNAPNILNPRDDSTATWTVCDWRDTAVPLSLLKTGDVTTTVIAGTDMLDGGTPLGSDRAVLVTTFDHPDTLWLLFRNTRAEVGREDFAAQAALGLTPAVLDSAIHVSDALLQSIEPSPALTAPRLDGQGDPSKAVIGSDIGDVLTTVTASGARDFYLVGRDGVQRVGSVLAQMMINVGATQHLVDDPSQVSGLPRTALVDDSRFPATVPTLTTDAALCWQWSKSRGELTAHTDIFTGSALPVTDDGRTANVTLLPRKGIGADASITRPGAGWYARVTGNNTDSVAAEQLLWIDPNGTAYPIDAAVSSDKSQVSFDPTVKALGFDQIVPTPIPASVARLYTPGSTLSIPNAQVLQGTLHPQTQIPEPEGGAPASHPDYQAEDPAPAPASKPKPTAEDKPDKPTAEDESGEKSGDESGGEKSGDESGDEDSDGPSATASSSRSAATTTTDRAARTGSTRTAK